VRGYFSFTGMIRSRTSSVAPWRLMAKRIWSSCSASFSIWGARPLVDTVIWRAPIPTPHSALSISIAAKEVAKIGERFAHAHEDDIVDPVAVEGFRLEDLLDDFVWR